MHSFQCTFAHFSVQIVGEHAGEKYDLLDLTLEKYNICLLIDVVNDVDTGKKSGIRFYKVTSFLIF